MGQFFKQYPEPNKLDDVHVDWRATDVNYLEEVKFSRYFSNLVAIAKPINGSDAVFKAYNIVGDVQIQYNDQMDFERITHKFGIFEKWKDGIPRMTYKGVVVFRFQMSRTIFLFEEDSLRQLGIQQT